MKSKQVVIIGGGFGGVACANTFARGFPNFDVTLVDRNPYHIIHSNLYELATSPEEIYDLKSLKQTVAIPFKQIFKGTRVKFQQGTVLSVDSKSNTVKLEHGSVQYDYLVSALGALPNYYGIEGAEKFAIPLQTPGDALLIRNKVEFAVQAHRHDTQKEMIRVMIAGGGIAGVEVAAELQGMLNFVAWKNSYPREKIHTVVIEGTGQILPNFDQRVVKDVDSRIRNFGVQILTHRMISKVDSNMVEFSNGEKMEYDCLVWTAGVKAMPLLLSPAPLVGRGDRIEVDEYFRVKKTQNIFAIGDQGCHHDSTGNPLPGNAVQAINQGEYVAEAIAGFAANKQPKMHSCKSFPVILPLGGKWAIVNGRSFYIKGYLGYLVREFVWLKYFADLVGWGDAFRRISTNEQLYSVND